MDYRNHDKYATLFEAFDKEKNDPKRGGYNSSVIPKFGENLHTDTNISPIIEKIKPFAPHETKVKFKEADNLEKTAIKAANVPDNVSSITTNIKGTYQNLSTLSNYLNSNSVFPMAITDQNYKLFLPYIRKISLMAQAFPNFSIGNLKNFQDFPLENYDVEIDPKLSIEYLISLNNMAKSRWFSKYKGCFEWKPCKILGYKDGKFEI